MPSEGGDQDFYGTTATITVGAGASVSGVTGITIATSAGSLSNYAPVNVTIDDFGATTGTGSGSGGMAAVGEQVTRPGEAMADRLAYIVRPSGSIGAINAHAPSRKSPG